nr:MAG TPA: hypothetical protein [Caudoviricetes sp.]
MYLFDCFDICNLFCNCLMTIDSIYNLSILSSKPISR